MNNKLKEKIRIIIMKEYRKHNEQVCEKHMNSGYFLNTWSQKMQKIGIEIFQERKYKSGYVAVCTGLFMGWVQIPKDIAKKILIFEGLP